jgi:hypothetical protein
MFKALIAHYAGTAFDKIVSSEMAMKYGTSSTNLQVGNEAFAWRSTAAITSIKIIPNSANFKAGTLFTLYGLN